ncbi:MAG: energy-coupling factor transporter transmembrane protein EcfT [Phyllobacteriaceae bacterium]|nr:energy-coupling factor transporter transmembrane protein EcfT [Phyllobacteriaceae bacterium]
MIDGLGSAGTTPLHRLPAGRKLVGLAVLATALFVIEQPIALSAAALLGLAVLRSTGRDLVGIGRDLRGPVIVIAAVGLVDLALVDAATALAVVLRLLALAFLARAVVVTTTTSELVDAFERGLAPLDRLGLVDAARASLTLTLAIRFVPLIVEEAGEIREAQAARGLGSHPLAIVVPLVVRTLVRAQTVADAIDARGFPPRKNSNKSH